MEVNPASAGAQSQYQGQTLYFCSIECKRKFDAHPEQYIDETDRAHGKAHRAQQAPNSSATPTLVRFRSGRSAGEPTAHPQRGSRLAAPRIGVNRL
jgi:YHS domain-containing protein